MVMAKEIPLLVEFVASLWGLPHPWKPVEWPKSQGVEIYPGSVIQRAGVPTSVPKAHG
jgi:hypothetical protein